MNPVNEIFALKTEVTSGSSFISLVFRDSGPTYLISHHVHTTLLDEVPFQQHWVSSHLDVPSDLLVASEPLPNPPAGFLVLQELKWGDPEVLFSDIF